MHRETSIPISPRIQQPPVDTEAPTKKSGAKPTLPTMHQLIEVQTLAEPARAKRADDVTDKMRTWGVSEPAIKTFVGNKGDVRRFHALFCGKKPIVAVRTDKTVEAVDTQKAINRKNPITSGTVLAMRGSLEDACSADLLDNDCQVILKQTHKMMKHGFRPASQAPDAAAKGIGCSEDREQKPATTLELKPSTDPDAKAEGRARKKTLVFSFDGLRTAAAKLTSPRSRVVGQPKGLFNISGSDLETHRNATKVFSASKKELLNCFGSSLDQIRKKLALQAGKRSSPTRPCNANRAKLIEHAVDRLKERIRTDETYAKSKTTIVRFNGEDPLYDSFLAQESYAPSKSSPSFVNYSSLSKDGQFLIAGNTFLGGGVVKPGLGFGQEEQAWYQHPEMLLFVAGESESDRRTTIRSSEQATATSHLDVWPVLIKGTTPILHIPESVARITSSTSAVTPDNVFRCPTDTFDPEQVLVPATGSTVSALCIAAPNAKAEDHYGMDVVRDMLANFAAGVKLLDPSVPLESVPWGAGIFGHDPRMSAAVQILACAAHGIILTIHGMDDAVFKEAQDAALAILGTFDAGQPIMLWDVVRLLVEEASTRGWMPNGPAGGGTKKQVELETAGSPQPTIEFDNEPQVTEVLRRSKATIMVRFERPLNRMRNEIAKRAVDRAPEEPAYVQNQSKTNRATLIQYAMNEFSKRVENDPEYATSETTIRQYIGKSPLWEERRADENLLQISVIWSPGFLNYSELDDGDQVVAPGSDYLGGDVLNPVGSNFTLAEQIWLLCPELLFFVAHESTWSGGRTRTRPNQFASEDSHLGSSPVLIETHPILLMPEEAGRITSHTKEATAANLFLSQPEDFKPELVLVPTAGSAVNMLWVAAPKVGNRLVYDFDLVRDLLATFAKGVSMLDRTKRLYSIPWGVGTYGHRPEMSAAVQILICHLYGITLNLHGMDVRAYEAGLFATREILGHPDRPNDLDDLARSLVGIAMNKGWALGKQ